MAKIHDGVKLDIFKFAGKPTASVFGSVCEGQKKSLWSGGDGVCGVAEGSPRDAWDLQQINVSIFM